MNLNDDFSLDSFGIGNAPDADSNSRLQRDVVDLVSVVIALDHSKPVQPKAASLQAIYGKISPRRVIPFHQRFLTWSGWAAAVAVGMFFVVQKAGSIRQSMTHDQQLHQQNHQQANSQNLPANQLSASKESSYFKDPLFLKGESDLVGGRVGVDAVNPEATKLANEKQAPQQRSLIQQGEPIRSQIAQLGSLDKERLLAKNGTSWPIIMQLNTPDHSIIGSVIDIEFELSALTLGDVFNSPQSKSRVDVSSVSPETDSVVASAVQIYDPLRDSGLLQVSNLSEIPKDQAYFLWVKSDQSAKPVLVGSLPQNFTSSETFDFNLGSVGIIPEQFVITQDNQKSPNSPDPSNTILISPENSKEDLYPDR
jgi:hypothetical protein